MRGVALLKKEQKHLLIYCALLSLLFLAVCSQSSFLYPLNDWYDANDFLTMGKGILHGFVPYRDLYEQKGPILYFLHSICALVPGPHFFGVYLLEAGAFTVFLYYAAKLILLYLPPRAAYWILPALSGLLLSSESFCQGDSAEELCAALLMVCLYDTMEYFTRSYPGPIPYRKLFTNGLLAGVIFWIKYTLLGLHLAFMAVLFFLYLKRKKYRRSAASCLVFLAGMALPAVPVLIYFAFHGALSDLMQVYFYNNIFLYDSQKSSGIFSLVLTIFLRIGDTFFRNLQFSLFTVIGVLAFLLTGRFLSCAAGKLMLLLEAGFLAFFIYTGSNFPYYGYILCIFPVLGFIAIGALAEFLTGKCRQLPSPREMAETIRRSLHHLLMRFLPPQFMGSFGNDPAYSSTDFRKEDGHASRRTWDASAQAEASRFRPGYLLAILVFLLFAFYKSPNTYRIGTPRKELVQYQFAEIIRETPDATLLNYGFLDAGFYTVCDILPTERFFQMQNISYEAFPEMMDSQNECIREQRVDYLILRGEEVPEWILDYYCIVKEQRQLYAGANVKYILLQKKPSGADTTR